MLWKKDRLRPTQPYFVLDTDRFFQQVYLQQGISHFYTFNVKEGALLRAVPDGCIDLFFEFDKQKMKGYVCGTRLAYHCEAYNNTAVVFGVRFMPGVQPEMLNATMKDVLDNKIPIEAVLKGSDEWLAKLAQEEDFYQRIRVFIEYYTKAEKQRVKPFGKKEIAQSVKNLVYKADGKIKVSQIEEATGYSERYINKVFIQEMGFSPKIFCKIIRFQRALEFLNYGAPDRMTDAAVFLGYYDQSHFIRDFTAYCGITPKKYLDLIVEGKYKNKIEHNVWG